ncbi:MAG: extracellular solute-binding protein [Georgenia sp.]
MTVALAACGSATPGSSEGTGGGAAADGTASAWMLTGGAEPAFRAQVEQWNADQPDKQLNVEWFANDAYKEKIRTAVGAGNSPTLIYSWAGGTLVDYVANDEVVDITAGTQDLLARTLPSIAANGQIDGKTYAVAFNPSQPVVLYYNQDVLDAAGVTVPTTYGDLLAAVATLKEQGIIPIALAGQSKWPELMYIQYLTDRIGGPEVFQSVLDGVAGSWSDPAIIEALTKIQQLADAGAFGEGFGSVTADADADVALVYTGKAAMLLQGGWAYPTFVANAPEMITSGALGFAPFPSVEGGKGDPANIVGNPSNFWSVSADAPAAAQATATEFLNTMVFSDSAVDELLSIGGVPPVAGLEGKIAKADNADFMSFAYGMLRDAPHFQLSWDQALPPAQAQALLDNLSQVFLGQITPKQFGETMNATLK